MTIFQGYDGELRIVEYGNNGTTYHLEVLFCEMDFTGPTKRSFPQETLILDRGRWDGQSRFREENDMDRFTPLSVSFSCRLADTVNSIVLNDLLSGVTNISGTTQLYSFKGKTTIDGINCSDFEGSTSKYAYLVELLWDGVYDYGLQYNEVWFDPGKQHITESTDGLMLSCNGLVYGDVSRISSFSISNSTSII